jgi:hypothetical protein
MLEGRTHLPGLKQRAPLAVKPPESLDEIRALVVRIAATVDDLNDLVRAMRATAGDDALKLNARLHELERRIARAEQPATAVQAPPAAPEARLEKNEGATRKAQSAPEARPKRAARAAATTAKARSKPAPGTRPKARAARASPPTTDAERAARARARLARRLKEEHDQRAADSGASSAGT